MGCLNEESILSTFHTGSSPFNVKKKNNHWKQPE